MDVTPQGYEADGQTVPWRYFLDEARAALAAAGVSSPESDARRIVEQASGFEGADLALGLGEPATMRGVTAFDAMLERRLGGEPLQYVLGRWGFRTLDLLVDRRVLIPRPETEVLAGVAIAELDRIAADSAPRAPTVGAATPTGSGAGAPGLAPGADPRGGLLAVDLGTGSGAIGLSLAVERPDVQVVMSDASADALAVARANLAGIGSAARRVTICEGDWFAALDPGLAGRVDVIAANPPYVAPDDELPAEVADWEPPSALVAPDDGLAHLHLIVDTAPVWLRTGGALVLEMAPSQTDTVAARARAVGYDTVEIIDDLAGRPRVVRARHQPPASSR